MATTPQLSNDLQCLKDHVWRRLGVRKHLVGRDTVDAAVMHSVMRWPPHSLAAAGDAEVSKQWQRDLTDYVVAAIANAEGSDKRYGFAIWAILLAAVVGQVVQVLLRWWLEHRFNQELMDQFRVFRGQV